MIMKRTKAALFAFAAAIALCLGMASTAWAALPDSDVSFKQVGDDVEVTLNGAGADVSTFSLALDVDVNADGEDAVQVGFVFSTFINDNTNIHEATFKTVGDETRIMLYVAGGHDLFAQEFQVGYITLGLDAAKSTGAEVIVEVPATEEVDPDDPNDEGRESFYALRTVTGARTMDEGGVSQAEPFVAMLGDRRTEQDPPLPSDPEQKPPIIDDGKDPDYMGPDDGLGPKDDPSQNNPYVSGDRLGQTGDDQMMVIGTLLTIVAVALFTMGVVIIYRKRKSQ